MRALAPCARVAPVKVIIFIALNYASISGQPGRRKHSGQSNMSQTIYRHLRITGRVQGVGYRWALCAEAEALGLAGWVRNRQDGSVEAVISGIAEAVEALTRWAHRGPPAAQVETVTCSEHSAEDCQALPGFEQRPTL
jgi:acylphosphatase